MTTPFLRSPIRSPRRGQHAKMADDDDDHNRHGKLAGTFNPYILGTVLVVLFAASYFWGPSNVPKTMSTDRLGADREPTAPQVAAPKPSLHLLGERHSGTKWMTEYLTECFGDDIEVRKSFSAWKHWFQKENPLIPNAVVVAQFRNPYYWVEAMHRFPHHSPNHFDLDWRSFVTKPWTMPRYGSDVEFEGSTAETTSHEAACRTGESFHPYEVIPCMANWTIVQELPLGEGRRITDAFYELRHDGSGQPYGSILDLRRDKVRNFLRVADFPNVKEAFAVQYDEMVKDGTDLLLVALENALGVKAKCNPYTGKGSPKRPLDPAFVEYLRAHIDWDSEALIGFTPRDV